MSNIINFPSIRITSAGRCESRVSRVLALAKQYAAVPKSITGNATLNRVAMELQDKGWTLTIHPCFVECRHPHVESQHPIGLMEAFEIQKTTKLTKEEK